MKFENYFFGIEMFCGHHMQKKILKNTVEEHLEFRFNI